MMRPRTPYSESVQRRRTKTPWEGRAFTDHDRQQSNLQNTAKLKPLDPYEQFEKQGTLYRSFYFQFSLSIKLYFLLSFVASSHCSQPCENFRFFKQQVYNASEQCTIWSDSAIAELCSTNTQSRIKMLRHIFLFPELQPLSLYELFSIGLQENNNWKLHSGEKGNDCIAGSITRCTACYQKLSGTLRRLEQAYRSFDVTLSRFDCLPAVDTATATRPFSPNATCENCKLWYRRWLLVQTLQIWQHAPCINWCYYTQLACPHLAPAKLWDYAGHPSFQCRDMDIDSWRQECDCIHPCDISGIVLPGVIGNAPSFRHDFFAAQVHCETRKKQCKVSSTKMPLLSSEKSRHFTCYFLIFFILTLMVS